VTPLRRAPSFANLKPTSARARLGVKYEQKVHARLEDLFGLEYNPSQWFAYGYRGETKYCQLDGLLFSEVRKLLILLEVKYSHTADAYWQVENLYLPVVRKWMQDSGYRIATVEVVKWYDPNVAFPRKPTLIDDILNAKPENFSVHILNR
jgi:hypothetical protein